MKLPEGFVIDRSANHCHLTREDAVSIFGDNMKLKLRELSIKGEYATNLKVQDEFDNEYTVLYPWRKYSQIEVAASNFYKIFKYYPDRKNSGDTAGAETVRVLGTLTKIPVIVVKPHVHVPKEFLYSHTHQLFNLSMPYRFEIKVSETIDSLCHIHLDTDQYAAIQGL